jgi:DNA-binding response OmpR family regulator
MFWGKPMRVLIMEDDAGQARLMQRTLERADYAVDIAGNGDAGLALYEAGAYAVLLIDHQMPGQGGLDVL